MHDCVCGVFHLWRYRFWLLHYFGTGAGSFLSASGGCADHGDSGFMRRILFGY